MDRGDNVQSTLASPISPRPHLTFEWTTGVDGLRLTFGSKRAARLAFDTVQNGNIKSYTVYIHLDEKNRSLDIWSPLHLIEADEMKIRLAATYVEQVEIHELGAESQADVVGDVVGRVVKKPLWYGVSAECRECNIWLQNDTNAEDLMKRLGDEFRSLRPVTWVQDIVIKRFEDGKEISHHRVTTVPQHTSWS